MLVNDFDFSPLIFPHQGEGEGEAEHTSQGRSYVRGCAEAELNLYEKPYEKCPKKLLHFAITLPLT